MQSTIDKLISDKKQLSEMLKDRENEINKFNDPRNLRELKSLLNDFEVNIDAMEDEKGRQYTEI